MEGKVKTLFLGGVEQRINNGLARVDEFFSKLMMNNQWMFIGYIDNNENAPIFIVHYALINMTIYTQKIISEDINDFAPRINLN